MFMTMLDRLQVNFVTVLKWIIQNLDLKLIVHDLCKILAVAFHCN